MPSSPSIVSSPSPPWISSSPLFPDKVSLPPNPFIKSSPISPVKISADVVPDRSKPDGVISKSPSANLSFMIFLTVSVPSIPRLSMTWYSA